MTKNEKIAKYQYADAESRFAKAKESGHGFMLYLKEEETFGGMIHDLDASTLAQMIYTIMEDHPAVAVRLLILMKSGHVPKSADGKMVGQA